MERSSRNSSFKDRKFQAIFASPNRWFTENSRFVPLISPSLVCKTLCNRLLCILRTLRQIKRALNTKAFLHTSQLTPGVLKETNKRQLWLLVEAITVFGKAITARRPPNTSAISAHVTLLS